MTRKIGRREAIAGLGAVNANDGIFSRETLLELSKDGDGYLGVFNIDVKRG